MPCLSWYQQFWIQFDTQKQSQAQRYSTKEDGTQKMNAMLMGFSFPFTVFFSWKIWIENHTVSMCQLCIYSQPCGVRSSLQLEPKSQFHSSRFDHVQPILAQKWIDFWFIALSETRMTNWLTDRLAYTGTSNKMKANTKNEKTKRWRSESKKKQNETIRSCSRFTMVCPWGLQKAYK